ADLEPCAPAELDRARDAPFGRIQLAALLLNAADVTVRVRLENFVADLLGQCEQGAVALERRLGVPRLLVRQPDVERGLGDASPVAEALANVPGAEEGGAGRLPVAALERGTVVELAQILGGIGHALLVGRLPSEGERSLQGGPRRGRVLA